MHAGDDLYRAAALVAGGLCVGLGAGFIAARRRKLTAKSSPPRSWGFFTEPVAAVGGSNAKSSLLVVRGAVPAERGGPLLWLARGPEDIPWDTPVAVPAAHPKLQLMGRQVAIDADAHTEAVQALVGKDCEWLSSRDLLRLPASGRASQTEVEAVVRAISLLGWHRSHAFSGIDGQPTTMVAGMEGRRRKLASGRSLYPRVDPVVIVLVQSACGERCLLVRQPKYSPGMVTCVSGFVEHGESVEHAAVREVLEETNVRCEAVQLCASQPWPCGRGGSCELMLAAFARAAADGEEIDVHAHPAEAGGGELEHAGWYSRAEARRLLDASSGGAQTPQVSGDNATIGRKVPPPYAIAHHLIARWCDGTLGVGAVSAT